MAKSSNSWKIFRCFFTNEYIQKSKEEIKTLTQQTEVQPSTSTQSTKNAKPQKEETEDLPESADADIEIDSVSQYTRTVRSSHSYKLPSTLPMFMANGMSFENLIFISENTLDVANIPNELILSQGYRATIVTNIYAYSKDCF